jgi:serine/threonine-protein kinase
MLEQIGQALDYAHCKGIVHRDVKPSNIIIGPDDRATLIDFGLAEVAEHSLLTSAGAVLGTPHYMAPEQAAGRSACPQSDQYALAAVAYELLTGAPPFQGRSATAVIHAHIYELPPPPTERRPSLPAGVNAVLLRALAKEPGQRYASLAEFVAALGAALAPPSPAPAARRRRPIGLLLGGAGGLAVVAALLLALLLTSGASGGGPMGLSAQRSARSGLPLPRQTVWSHSGPNQLAGGPAPVVSGGMVIVGTLDGQVVGFETGGGEPIWRVGGEGAALFGAPSASNGLAFVGSADGFVQGLSLRSGKATWQTRVVGVAQQAPTIDGDRLIVTTDKGYIYMLQAGSGQVIWDRPLAQSALPPTVGAGRIFLSAGPTLFALDASNGAVDWAFDAASAITTRAVIAGDMVVVGTERGLLYALMMANGRPHLRYQASGALGAAPAADASTIYVADQSGSLAAISLTNATMLWRFDGDAAIMAAPLLAEGRLFFGAADGRFYTLDARDGRELASMQLGGSVTSSPALGDGLIFVRADRVYALGE